MLELAESLLIRRHATLIDLADLLRQQHAAKLDVVVPAGQVRAAGGFLRIAGAGQPDISADGVTSRAGVFWPTATCDEGIADKLGIPVAYLRRTRERHADLYDANVNTWLAEQPDRRFLVRTLRSDGDRPGIARALLSDQYRITDNLDVLMAVLNGVRQAGASVQVSGCDLTERRMYVALRSDEIAAHAPLLLGDYTSPFNGARGADNPLVFAGFVVSNSETGHGSFSITPRITVQVCDNGMTINADAIRAVHLGGRLDDGQIRWSAGTHKAALDLVTAKARDAVGAFLDRDYLTAAISRIEKHAQVRVDDVPATLEYVSTQLRFSAAQQKTILEHFIDGGDRTAGGVLHAVTSTAQTLPDADTAYDMERAGIRAMTLAAQFQH